MIMETGEEGRQKTYSILVTLNEKHLELPFFLPLPTSETFPGKLCQLL